MLKRKLVSTLLSLALFIPMLTLAKEPGVFMPQGQIQGNVIEVFITDAEIDSLEKTRLKLTAARYVSSKSTFPADGIIPIEVINNQQREIVVKGRRSTKTGTVLFFSPLTDYNMFALTPVIQFIPVVTWDRNGQAVSAEAIYLGDYTRAFSYTLTIMLIIILTIAAMVKTKDQRFIHLFCDKSKHLSLSRTQVGLWTLAIGSMVVAFGLIKIVIPDIPEQLVALMGLSLATGSVVYLKDKPNPVAPSNTLSIEPQLGDLVREYGEGGKAELSIARAQMVFWTGITLVLFICKSLLNGELWEVPWEMVALMGISQASYLVPKVTTSANIISTPPTTGTNTP